MPPTTRKPHAAEGDSKEADEAAKAAEAADRQDDADEAGDAEDLAGKYVVTYDVFTWQVPIPGKPGKTHHMHAWAGDTVNIDHDTAERALKYGAVAKPENAPAVRRAVETLAGPVAGDNELSAMSAAELIAYVGQNPTEAQRVYNFEAANAGRLNVMQATGLRGDIQAPSSGTGVQG